MFRILLEPLFVALENDIRLRELNILREAAEAEKRSLLTRLRRGGLEELVVGAESGLKLVMERVRTVAKSDVPVMILGETGTGKEVISREIHRLSARAKGPFIRVNCGAIPSELIDSQLFGHERGAFTGAVSSHMGWFERADGGTLFLDEIGELSSAGQVRLLRIIQDGWLERIGSTAPTHVDVRIVVATHQDLAGMISRGGFREDLWYRLAVFPIYLPPLRERKKDIPALALHFAEKAALRFGLALQKPTEEDIRLLSEYDWPGNVRELGSVIDRAALLGDGDGLQVPAALGWLNFMQSGPDPDISVLTPGTDKLLPLDVMVKKHIKTVLQNTRGRIEGEQGAASILQLNPNTLRSKIRKLGIKSGEFRD
ncbi:sigma-54-dependent Fis family transcriptional regulator [candidate division KSB1 bacterium]|nr:sigma-54-dependent Fis family transcriptional regulator [candidate division KSB1 bacterium]